MVTPNGGGGRCRRIRHLWLSMFLLLLVIATTAALLGLLTPSWQVVYLEDGRTEHHHGLWLDCKRDFSYDYGRPREYYETLHRRFDLAGPFDQFWLPPLLCVFKFDYWLDDEDWYEFGYDENRLWGDAYQHLFLGWKIAALVAHLTAAICSFVSILFIICAYCHRLCTCVAAVLVTLAVLSQLGGNVIFYAFASNQNTNIIKEEDGIYEQHFGWSFWMSIMANCLMLLTSFTGCLTTKVVLGKTRTKLIKIQTDDFGDDSTQLLRLSAASSTYVPHQQHHHHQNGGPPPMQFRRSPPAGRKSAIYKIESNDLKRWERERMRSVEKGAQFKRTNSMPMIRRQLSDHQLHNASSISDLSNPGIMVVSGPSQTPFCPTRGTANGPCYAPTATPADVIYEYVDQGSLSLASTLKAGDFLRSRSKFNVYDPVPPMSNGQQQQRQQQQHRRVESTSIGTQQIADNDHQQQQRREIYGDNEYLQPKSLTSNESDDNNLASSSTVRHQKALIVPVDVGTFRAISRECPVVPTTTTTSSSLSSPPSMASAYEHVMPQIPLNTFPNQTPPQRQWEAEILAELKQRQQQKQQQQQRQNLIENHSRSSSQRRLCPPILSEVPSPLSTVAQQSLGTTTVSRDSYRIQINTFQSMADRQQQQQQPYLINPINNRYSRSITDLVPLGHNGTALPVRAFERGQVDSPERSTISTTLSSVQGENSPPTFLGAEVPPPMGTSLLRQRLGSASVALRGSAADWRRGTLQSEAERSLGSSRAATTFLGSPPEAAAATDFGQTVTKTFGHNGGVDNVGQSVDQQFGRRKFFGQNDVSPGTDV